MQCFYFNLHSLKTNDVDHVFMCLFVIHISFSHLIIGFLLSFLNIKFEISLYIMNTSSLSNMWFASIFSQSVTFLILLTRSFKGHKFFILMKCNLSICWGFFVLCVCVFGVCVTCAFYIEMFYGLKQWFTDLLCNSK